MSFNINDFDKKESGELFINQDFVNGEDIEFILISKKGNFRNKLNFSKIKATPCFNFDSNLEEAIITMNSLIRANKTYYQHIDSDENSIFLIFEEEMTRKKIKSLFTLVSEKKCLNDLLNVFENKIDFFINENQKDVNIGVLTILKGDYLQNKNLLSDFIENSNKLNKQFCNNLIQTLKEIKTKNVILSDKFEQTTSINEKLMADLYKYQCSNEKLTEENNILNKELTQLKDKYLNKQEAVNIEENLINYENSIFSKQSKILLDEELNLLKNWFGKEYKMELLYSSFIDEKDKRIFHLNVDDKENILILIQSDQNRRFGGFTKLSLNSAPGYVEGDGTDFIFSLSKRRRFLNNQKDKAIRNHPGYFVIFGAGHDICLHESCFEKFSDYTFTNFPYSYGIGEYLDEEKKTFLAGKFSFKVLALEAFKIEFI